MAAEYFRENRRVKHEAWESWILHKKKANPGLQISIMTAYFVTSQGKGFMEEYGGLQQRFGRNVRISGFGALFRVIEEVASTRDGWHITSVPKKTCDGEF